MRLLFIFVAATFALRLLAIFTTGFCDDEAYVVAISRAPALSYFDHPPLHQWILTAWTAAFGEGRAARLPFLGLFLVNNFALFFLTRRLFSSAAAWWTLFVFNASAYFLVHPDGYIMPDSALLTFCALGVWAVAEILQGPPRRATPLWLAAGLALGLAGLSKYSAIFVPLGLAGYFALSPKARRWLADPRPYLGAAVALVCLTPTLAWNAEHGWVSLAFQSGRAASRLAFNLKALREILEGASAQVVAMTPWVLIPIVGGVVRAFRKGADSPERLMLWLALPPLALFALLPLLGQRPIAHWFNSGWLFAFPLAGAWLAQKSQEFLARFAATSAALALLIYVAFLAAIWAGPIQIHGLRDPTGGMFDFPEAALRAAYAKSGADFVLIENWRRGGRVGVALGPKVAICAMGEDPRGFAFACDMTKRLGQNALIVRRKSTSPLDDPAPFFKSVESLGDLPVGRRGRVEETLTLDLGRDLLRAPPLPYGP